MVDRQHHGAAGGRSEHPRHPVLHAPIELMGAFEEKARRLLRLIERVAFAFFVSFRHGAPLFAIGPDVCVIALAQSKASEPNPLIRRLFIEPKLGVRITSSRRGNWNNSARFIVSWQCS